jgi:hypothetical protein
MSKKNAKVGLSADLFDTGGCPMFGNAVSGMTAERRFETSLKRLKCANTGHSPTAWRTCQIDPKRAFPVATGTEGIRA